MIVTPTPPRADLHVHSVASPADTWVRESTNRLENLTFARLRAHSVDKPLDLWTGAIEWAPVPKLHRWNPIRHQVAVDLPALGWPHPGSPPSIVSVQLALRSPARLYAWR